MSGASEEIIDRSLSLNEKMISISCICEIINVFLDNVLTYILNTNDDVLKDSVKLKRAEIEEVKNESGASEKNDSTF